MSRHRRQQHKRARRAALAEPAMSRDIYRYLSMPVTLPKSSSRNIDGHRKILKQLKTDGFWQCACPERVNPPNRHRCKKCGMRLPLEVTA